MKDHTRNLEKVICDKRRNKKASHIHNISYVICVLSISCVLVIAAAMDKEGSLGGEAFAFAAYNVNNGTCSAWHLIT